MSRATLLRNWWLLRRQKARRRQHAAAAEPVVDFVAGEDGGAILGEDGTEVVLENAGEK